MSRRVWVLGIAALLVPSAHAQHGDHAAHGADKALAARPAVNAESAEGTHRSAFTGYRRFNAEEPLKDWRAANEEVRAAGGHAGLSKGSASGGKAAAPEHRGHESHGKKKP